VRAEEGGELSSNSLQRATLAVVCCRRAALLMDPQLPDFPSRSLSKPSQIDASFGKALVQAHLSASHKGGWQALLGAVLAAARAPLSFAQQPQHQSASVEIILWPDLTVPLVLKRARKNGIV
jgi:hypothetical protein